MASEYTPYPFPLSFRGIKQKDIGLLEPGEFYDAKNVIELASGAIVTRSGRKLLGTMSGATNPTKIAKLAWSSTDANNPRYISEGDAIYRTLDYASFTSVASAVNNAGDTEFRFTAAPFSAGPYSGDPYIYLATRYKMLKDYGPTPYASLRKWGILPPSAAASCVVGTAFSKDIITSPATLTGSTTASYETLTVSASSFDLGAFSSSKASGFQRDGYDSDDYIELQLEIENVQSITDIRLQVDIDDGSYVSFYEKSIAPSQITSAVILSETTTEALIDRSPYVDSQIYGPYDSPDSITSSAAPVELQPAYTTLNQILRIKKSDFLKVNEAGKKNQDTLNWKTVTDIRLIVKSSATGYDVIVHYMKLVGGYGPNSEISVNAQPYDYRYVHRNTTTGNVGNPSATMVEKNFVRSNREPITVTVHGVDDANISGSNSIAIYRRGGVLTDGLYRLVGYATNPGETAGVPNSTTFTDSFSDNDIAGAEILEFDNDPPVTSALSSPFRAALTSGPYSAGWRTVTITGATTADITAGTVMQLMRNTDSEFNETVVVQAVIASNQVRVYLQYDHADGDELNCSAAVGKACRGVVESGDCLYVYGDENNPHVLYKSKRGRPESFPVIASDGTSNQAVVGSPGDPIMAATEFGGEVVTLNLQSIYAIKVWGGILQEPIKMPAQRGLFSKHAWCKADNAIYYLSYDGVYAWSGGQSVKLSQDIDWVFKRRTINGIPPIDLTTKRNDISMSFHNNYLYLVCWDTDGNLVRWRFDTVAQTWVRESFASASANYMLSELDTGRLITCRYSASGGLVSEEDMDGTTGTSDDWTGTGGVNGNAIAFHLRTAAFAPGGPSITKLFGDVQLELSNPTSDVTVKMYYDHSTTADATDTFTIAAAAGRRLVALPLQQSGGYTSGKEARSVSVEISGNGGLVPSRTSFYSIVFNAIPQAQVQQGRVTDWDDVGYPHDKRLYEFVIEYDTGGTAVDLALDTVNGISGNNISSAVQTFALTGSGRSQATLKATDGIIAKKFRVRPTVESAHFRIFSVNYVCENYPPDIVPFTPYDDYKHPYEKHLQVLHLDVDTGNVAASVDIEGDGAVLQTVSVTSTEATRHQQFALTNALIAKKIRLKATAGSSGKFQLHGHRFEFEPYPPDTVYFTETSEYGYPYLKYLQQLIIDVNTNNQIVPVTIEGDGVDLETVNIQTTRTDRRRHITLQESQTARKIRLKVGTIPSGGRFQLFSHDFVHLPADKGPVKHTFDWDDLGYPYDKRLTTVVLEYDKGASACTMVMDTITGINGDTINLAVQSFVLTGTGRSLQQFAITDGTIVKMIRIRPVNVPDTAFKHWDYKFPDMEKLPADKSLFTAWSDLGWPCDKTFRHITLEMDTGNVAATVAAQIDGTTVQSFSVTSTDIDRMRILTFNANYSGKMFRLLNTPGSGGKAQLYNFKADFVREPCAVTRWDSLEVTLGYNGYKFIKQIWLQYTCASTITFTIYRDGETQFYQTTLPIQSAKEERQFYLPENVGAALNKSKRYRFVLSSASPFKFWAEGSRIEWLPLGYDQRSAFVPTTFHHMVKPAAFAEAPA